MPDFDLPELDLYVECTTMRSEFIGRKRRKPRRAMKQHGIRVILVMLPAELEDDADGRLRRTAMLEQVDSLMEIDVERGRDSLGVRSVVTGAFELLQTPLEDVVLRRCGRDLEPLHSRDVPSAGGRETTRHTA